MLARWMLAGIHTDNLIILAKGGSATVRDFVAPYQGSVKEPTYQIRGYVRNTMPSLVIECGDSESLLQDDKNLWLHGSQGVRVVILVKYFRENARNQVKVLMEIWKTGQPVESISLFPDPTIPNPPKDLAPPGPLPAAGGPHIVMDDLYSGQCPPDVVGTTQLPLDIHSLRCFIHDWATRAGVALIP
ncbi:hypothetical protein BDN72DRAFT_836264 [Pluteus cervinus]|uniref:Uncharacterized protein n=1 Tax=Pluteus cervinus TaxID=181527 RepID=A0ACD3B398_9AGAR|nr:hypothetical protein BDN72DRAFT_836264 [Pluteus cervinus]